MTEEDRFILKNELSYAPIRTRLDKITCNECGRHFYVDYKVIPSVCPFCESPTSTEPYMCSETGIFLNEEGVTTFSSCLIRHKKIRCVDCKYLVEIDKDGR